MGIFPPFLAHKKRSRPLIFLQPSLIASAVLSLWSAVISSHVHHTLRRYTASLLKRRRAFITLMSTNHIKQSLEMKCCRIFTTSNVRCSIECVCNSSGGVDIDQMQSSGKRGGGHSMKQSVLPFDLFISPSAAPANNYFPSLVVFFVFVLVIVFLLVRSCLLITLIRCLKI